MEALPAIIAWFILNIIIGNLNGWILRSGFNYPVLLTLVHMVVSWIQRAYCTIHSQVCDADTTTDRQTVKRHTHNGSARSRAIESGATQWGRLTPCAPS